MASDEKSRPTPAEEALDAWYVIRNNGGLRSLLIRTSNILEICNDDIATKLSNLYLILEHLHETYQCLCKIEDVQLPSDRDYIVNAGKNIAILRNAIYRMVSLERIESPILMQNSDGDKVYKFGKALMACELQYWNISAAYVPNGIYSKLWGRCKKLAYQYHGFEVGLKKINPTDQIPIIVRGTDCAPRDIYEFKVVMLRVRRIMRRQK